MNLFKDCTGRSLENGLVWVNEPAVWEFHHGELTITPDGETDVFRKYGQPAKDSACFLYTRVQGDFTLISKMRVDSKAFADAGAITIRSDETLWAKLCIERSPLGEMSIVSVVTDTWSDDANNELLKTPEAFLRITRIGDVVGMHYSIDGKIWRFARTFGLQWPESVMVGVQAQAPVRNGCRVIVEELNLSRQVVTNFRSGE